MPQRRPDRAKIAIFTRSTLMPVRKAMRSPPPTALTSRPKTVKFRTTQATRISTTAISAEWGRPKLRPEKTSRNVSSSMEIGAPRVKNSTRPR